MSFRRTKMRFSRKTKSSFAALKKGEPMIVVRDVFQIEPEKMKQAKDEIKKHRQLTTPLGYRMTRVMTDLTGEYYTLVLESEFSGLAEYEKALKNIFADKGWQESYGRLRKSVRSGRREIYTVVD
jgi:hypothetical protein